MHKNHLTVLLAALSVLIITALNGSIYIAVQQDIRTGANDPQIQLAEDGAAALAGGASPESVAVLPAVDLAQSLAPFIVIFDEDGNRIAASATLHGNPIRIPSGALQASRAGENKVTWQPEPGDREALVIRHFEGEHPGFIAVGRSLREAEKRVNALTVNLGLAWLVSVIASLFLILIFRFVSRTGNS